MNTLTPFQKAKIAEVEAWRREHKPEAPMPCIIGAVRRWLDNGREGAFPEPVLNFG